MLEIARVVGIHPESYAVDIVVLRTGTRLSAVQVLSPMAGSAFGHADLPKPDLTTPADPYATERTERDIFAVVAMADRLPLVIGFLFPQVAQCLFPDVERAVHRHCSDVYSTIDSEGNTEWRHPSGTRIRVGTTPEHDDLTGRDYDGRWAIERNTDKAVHLRVEVHNAGSKVATIDVDPSGNVLLDHDGNLTINTRGATQVNVEGTTTVASGGAAVVQAPSVTLDTPQATCTGKLTVQGLLTYQSGMVGQGGSGATAKINGSIEVEGGDVTADEISLKLHRHTEQGDGAPTSAPHP